MTKLFERCLGRISWRSRSNGSRMKRCAVITLSEEPQAAGYDAHVQHFGQRYGLF